MLNRSVLTGPLIWSTIAISLCVILVVSGLAPILGAAFSGGIGDQRPSEFLARLENAHERSLDTDAARVDGRNLFYPTQKTPKAKPPPIITTPTATTPDPPVIVAPAPPEPPATYRGPGIIAVMGEDVWFSPIRAGEKPLIVHKGEEKSGVTVISTSPPWSARLGHDGGEYDVSLLDREFPGLVTTASLKADVPGLITAALPAQAPPAAEATGEIADEGAAAGEDEESNDREVEAAAPAPADDVLAARSGSSSGGVKADPGTGRPRPAIPKPTPPGPEVN